MKILPHEFILSDNETEEEKKKSLTLLKYLQWYIRDEWGTKIALIFQIALFLHSNNHCNPIGKSWRDINAQNVWKYSMFIATINIF